MPRLRLPHRPHAVRARLSRVVPAAVGADAQHVPDLPARDRAGPGPARAAPHLDAARLARSHQPRRTLCGRRRRRRGGGRRGRRWGRRIEEQVPDNVADIYGCSGGHVSKPQRAKSHAHGRQRPHGDESAAARGLVRRLAASAARGVLGVTQPLWPEGAGRRRRAHRRNHPSPQPRGARRARKPPLRRRTNPRRRAVLQQRRVVLEQQRLVAEHFEGVTAASRVTDLGRRHERLELAGGDCDGAVGIHPPEELVGVGKGAAGPLQ
mmetsp:Transcript_45327/g.145858  ORF Transcript_45327/g.145858 Transcript_45327/m.145858 type:complete len:265 (+) Transcript_45327:427-1221(+)